MKRPGCLFLAFLLVAYGGGFRILGAAGDPKIELMRTPDSGIQPQAVVDGRGSVHLIYLKGNPRAADIFHVQRTQRRKDYSKPERVNSQPGTAVAMGTIRGAQLAVGRNGRVYVVWNGSQVPGSTATAPLFFTRLNDAGTAFEPQRNLMTWTAGLDGGGSVAADAKGNVYVMWHGRDGSAGSQDGEGSRAVFVTCSHDGGQTFDREKRANPEATGACGCCGMKAFADREGNLYALYRAATRVLNRDMILLASRDGAGSFASGLAQAWKIGSCPMSSASLAQANGGVLAAWETNGQVYFSKFETGTVQMSVWIAPTGSGRRKHPVVVDNANGTTLLAWSEETGWQKGGWLAWQVFDRAGKPVGDVRRVDGVPIWSLPTAWAEPGGGFVIVY